MRRAGTRAAVALGVVAWAMVSGCSSYDAPRLAVSSVSLAERSDEAVVLVFTVDAANSNEEALPLERVRYTVRLNDRVVFRGTRWAEATLRRVGTQQITLPAAILLEDAPELAEGGSASVPYRISGRMTYVTPGEIAQLLFDAGVRRPKVRFSDEGVLEFGE